MSFDFFFFSSLLAFSDRLSEKLKLFETNIFFPLYISFKIEVQNVLQSDFSYSCSTLNPAAQTRII